MAGEGASAGRLADQAETSGFRVGSTREVSNSSAKTAATRKPRILSLEGAYHGCTMGACALMQKGMFRDLFEPHLLFGHAGELA